MPRERGSWPGSAAPPSPATTGCAAGPMPQMRKALEDGLERALIGKDARTSLVKVKENVAESVDSYNESVGG